MKNQRLQKIFQNRPYETRLMVAMLEELLGESKVEAVMESMEKSSPAQSLIKIAGKPLRYFSGMSDEQLDKLLSKEEKEEFYTHFDKPVRRVAQAEEVEAETPQEEEAPKASSKSGNK